MKLSLTLRRFVKISPLAQTFLCLVRAHALSHLPHTQSRCRLVPLYTPPPEAGALISALHREQDQASDAIDSNSSWHPELPAFDWYRALFSVEVISLILPANPPCPVGISTIPFLRGIQ